MIIHKQEVTFLLLPVLQQVVPLFANTKSHYYSFKLYIKVQNMCQTYLLIIKTKMCDSFTYLERVPS